MAERRLTAIIAALLLVANGAKAVETSASINDLRVIEDYVSKKAWRPLYDFLSSNPQLLSDKGPLSSELCTFVQDVERGELDVFVSRWDRLLNANRFDPTCNLRTASKRTPRGGTIY